MDTSSGKQVKSPMKSLEHGNEKKALREKLNLFKKKLKTRPYRSTILKQK